jgi:RimJ/RimL family protein N-acetyltransferase
MEIPTLQTNRLILRGWREADLDRYCMLRGDAEASQFIGGVMSRDETWRNIATLLGHWMLRGFGVFALEEKATGQFVGYCGPWFPHGFPEREIGWALLPSAQGKGFATEAARRARSFAYEQLGWTTAISLIVSENVNSRRVAQRLGATLDGTAEFRGKTCDVWRHPQPAELPPAELKGRAM